VRLAQGRQCMRYDTNAGAGRQDGSAEESRFPWVVVCMWLQLRTATELATAAADLQILGTRRARDVTRLHADVKRVRRLQPRDAEVGALARHGALRTSEAQSGGGERLSSGICPCPGDHAAPGPGRGVPRCRGTAGVRHPCFCRQRHRHLHSPQPVKHHRAVPAIDVVDRSLEQADAGADAHGRAGHVIQRAAGSHDCDAERRRSCRKTGKIPLVGLVLCFLPPPPRCIRYKLQI